MKRLIRRLLHWLQCYRATIGRPDRRRVWHRARAENFFFLPCPVCGEWFGGQEILHLETRTLFTHQDGLIAHGLLVCPRESCREVAAKSWEVDPYYDVKDDVS